VNSIAVPRFSGIASNFVTEGIESAVKQAKTAALRKSVGVRGADTIQQCLNAGFLDEIHVDIAAVLLRLASSCFSYSPAVSPSIPGAPSLRVRRNASFNQSMSMWCASVFSARFLSSFAAFRLSQVGVGPGTVSLAE